MGSPGGVPVIDTMVGVPQRAREDWVGLYEPLVRDDESRSFGHGAGYMFKDLPEVGRDGFIEHLLHQMDHHGIERAMIPVSFRDEIGQRAVTDHPGRFIAAYHVDPNLGVAGVRDLVRAVEEFGVRAATAFPCGYNPQVPINDKRFYPLYAKCVELDIPIFINAGVPGPRFPMYPQHVEHLDEVCWFFPELRVVTRHGCEPWVDLAVKLLLKWPNLYYSTSAFAPRYYPQAIIDLANTRGEDKIIFAGYYPSGLSLDRIFDELPRVPFREHVWPKFLRENALRVLKLT